VTGAASERRAGRPRSERARRAVLEAVDDLLVEQGYAAMTMKGIAERAGVGRQTVYRWWSTKAEILLEACVADSDQLFTPAHPEPAEDLLAYLTAVTRFLTRDDAGRAYLALLGEAQHDTAVRELIVAADLLAPSARAVLDRVRPTAAGMPAPRLAAAQLVGPVLIEILGGPRPLGPRLLRAHVTQLLRAWRG
jgi:AcrR family transcriptional regulator